MHATYTNPPTGLTARAKFVAPVSNDPEQPANVQMCILPRNSAAHRCPESSLAIASGLTSKIRLRFPELTSAMSTEPFELRYNFAAIDDPAGLTARFAANDCRSSQTTYDFWSADDTALTHRRRRLRTQPTANRLRRVIETGL